MGRRQRSPLVLFNHNTSIKQIQEILEKALPDNKVLSARAFWKDIIESGLNRQKILGMIFKEFNSFYKTIHDSGLWMKVPYAFECALNRKIPKCKICGIASKGWGAGLQEKGPTTFCSKECMYKDPDRISKAQRTYFKEHGYTSPNLNPAVQEKKRHNSRIAWGYDSPQSSPEVRNRIEASMLISHGRRNFFLGKEGAMAVAKAMVTKHGVPHNSKLPGMIAKRESSYHAKHGVRNPQQNPEVRAKFRKTAFRHTSFTNRKGTSMMLQGFEPLVAKALEDDGFTIESAEDNGIRIEYSFERKGRSRYYFPDLIAIRNKKKFLVEVKSEFSVRQPRVLEKFLAAQKFCESEGWSNYVLVIWNKDIKSAKSFVGRRGYAALLKILQS